MRPIHIHLNTLRSNAILIAFLLIFFFITATLYIPNFITYINSANGEAAGGDGGSAGGGDGGSAGGGDGGSSGGGDGGSPAGGDIGSPAGSDAGSPAGEAAAPGAPAAPEGPAPAAAPGPAPAAPGPAPAGTPPAAPPAAPPAGPGPSGPSGPGNQPFLGVCLDREATNYGGTLPCLYPPSTITVSRSITPLSFVYLSQVPYTGIADNAATYAFLITTLAISGFLSYQFMYGKKQDFLLFAGISGIANAFKFSFPAKAASKDLSAKIEMPIMHQTPHSVALFVKALLEPDHDTAFMVLRSPEREGTSARSFIVKTIAEIETAYRIKMGEAGVIHPTTAEAVEQHTPATLEILLAHLVSAVNTPFTSEALAAQIAVVKITEALNEPLTQ